MSVVSAVVDLVVPGRCAGCGAPAGPWCRECARSLSGGPVPVERPGLVAAHALGIYRGPARRAVLAYKERGRRDLARAFGAALAAGVAALAPPPGLVLVPVPSRPSAARRRGIQHMRLVASRCAAELGSRAVPVLTLDRRAADSVGLDAPARAANLAGRLRPARLHTLPRGTPVAVLDDVITTGATAVACGAALAGLGLDVRFTLALTTTG